MKRDPWQTTQFLFVVNAHADLNIPFCVITSFGRNYLVFVLSALNPSLLFASKSAVDHMISLATYSDHWVDKSDNTAVIHRLVLKAGRSLAQKIIPSQVCKCTSVELLVYIQGTYTGAREDLC